ncbi:MAG TPA: hypothetical protein VGW74_13600 [Propionibacteriaceae bacterium]|nr:hypothetical protein [Propionibacteriaceae bacterium]
MPIDPSMLAKSIGTLTDLHPELDLPETLHQAVIAARSRSGSRSVSVAMLLASRMGSMGIGVAFFRSPNWRTLSTGQA